MLQQPVKSAVKTTMRVGGGGQREREKGGRESRERQKETGVREGQRDRAWERERGPKESLEAVPIEP